MEKTLQQYQAGEMYMLELSNKPTVIRIVGNDIIKIPGCGKRKWGAPVDDYTPSYDDHVVAWDEVTDEPVLLNKFELQGAVPAESEDLKIITKARYMTINKIISMLHSNS